MAEYNPLNFNGIRIVDGNKYYIIEISNNLLERHIKSIRKDDFEPRGFMIDTSIVRPAVDALTLEADPLIKDTFGKVTKLGLSYNRDKLTRGYYFWFWNLVATNTTRKLIENGIVDKMGTGQFKIESIPKIK